MKRKPNIHLLYKHVVVFINPFHFLNSWIILYHPMQIKKIRIKSRSIIVPRCIISNRRVDGKVSIGVLPAEELTDFQINDPTRNDVESSRRLHQIVDHLLSRETIPSFHGSIRRNKV